jgi:hypothetical protein
MRRTRLIAGYDYELLILQNASDMYDVQLARIGERDHTVFAVKRKEQNQKARLPS